ncbi:MAG: hypothetical protein KDD04_07020, partial [Sinomicrobium sp.]|nr:hypothetical protein [Sinomicrobium sp.]
MTTGLSYGQVTDTGDKVGIGVATPAEKLQVTGNILIRNPKQNGALIISGSANGYGVDPELFIQAAEGGGGDGTPYH